MNVWSIRLFALFAAVILLSQSVYVVKQTQYAVVFQFGEAVKIQKSPGLKMKMPFIQTVDFFDKRILTVEAEAKELTSVDGKRVIVDAFTKFTITDPVKFYKTVHNYNGVQMRLGTILESAMRKVIGKVSLTSLLTEERVTAMLNIKKLVNEEGAIFGVTVQDVRILRADLPKDNAQAIHKRMQAEREKEAKQIRAEGDEESSKIRSAADKDSQILLAKAYAEAQGIKAEGDSIAADIYNSCYAQDPEFYSFYRSLETYKQILGKNTNIVLSSKADLFKYLNLDSAGR